MRRDTDAQSNAETGPTFTFDSAEQYEAMAWSIPGGAQITAYGQATNGSSNSSVPNAPSLTPGGTRDLLWITVFGADNNLSRTVTGTPSGYSGATSRWNGNTGGVLLGGAHKATTATTTEDAGSWTLSGSETWSAATVALAP